MKTPGRIAALVCWALAFICVTSVFWQAFGIVRPALFWESASAQMQGTRLSFTHTGDAHLVFYVEAKVRYSCKGQTLETIGASDLHTLEFSEARRLQRAIAKESQIRVYCSPDDPSKVRLALDYPRLYTGWIPSLFAGAILLVGAGFWLRRTWLPPVRCGRCNMPIKRHYNYCPHCRVSLRQSVPAPVTETAHQIPHDGLAQS